MAGTFKEDLHPRGGKGSAAGGQFKSKGGSVEHFDASAASLSSSVAKAEELFSDYAFGSLIKQVSRGEPVKVGDVDGGGNALTEQDVKDINQAAELLQKLASKENSGRKELWRGMVLPAGTDLNEMFKPKSAVTWKGLTATTSSQELAKKYTDAQYAGDETGVVPALIRITRGDGITGHNSTSGELAGAETILPHGMRLRVTRIDTSGPIAIINVRERSPVKGKEDTPAPKAPAPPPEPVPPPAPPPPTPEPVPTPAPTPGSAAPPSKSGEEAFPFFTEMKGSVEIGRRKNTFGIELVWKNNSADWKSVRDVNDAFIGRYDFRFSPEPGIPENTAIERGRTIDATLTSMHNRLPGLTRVHQAGYTQPVQLRQLFNLVLDKGHKVNDDNAIGLYNSGAQTITLGTGLKQGYKASEGSLAKKGGEWSTTAQTIQGVLRHEYGHAVQERFEGTVRANNGFGIAKPTETGAFQAVVVRMYREAGGDKKVNRHKSPIGKKLSVYGATNSKEWFAESFAAYSHPDYGKPDTLRIDPTLEKLFDKVFK